MSRDEIEQTIAEARAYILAYALDAAEQGWYRERNGIVLGSGRTRLSSKGAPTQHPVWSDDRREAIEAERRWGIETGSLQEVEWNFAKYPRAWTPEMALEAREVLHADQREREAQHLKSIESTYPATVEEATTHLNAHQVQAIRDTAERVLGRAATDHRQTQWETDRHAFRQTLALGRQEQEQGQESRAGRGYSR